MGLKDIFSDECIAVFERAKYHAAFEKKSVIEFSHLFIALVENHSEIVSTLLKIEPNNLYKSLRVQSIQKDRDRKVEVSFRYDPFFTELITKYKSSEKISINYLIKLLIVNFEKYFENIFSDSSFRPIFKSLSEEYKVVVTELLPADYDSSLASKSDVGFLFPEHESALVSLSNLFSIFIKKTDLIIRKPTCAVLISPPDYSIYEMSLQLLKKNHGVSKKIHLIDLRKMDLNEFNIHRKMDDILSVISHNSNDPREIIFFQGINSKTINMLSDILEYGQYWGVNRFINLSGCLFLLSFESNSELTSYHSPMFSNQVALKNKYKLFFSNDESIKYFSGISDEIIIFKEISKYTLYNYLKHLIKESFKTLHKDVQFNFNNESSNSFFIMLLLKSFIENVRFPSMISFLKREFINDLLQFQSIIAKSNFIIFTLRILDNYYQSVIDKFFNNRKILYVDDQKRDYESFVKNVADLLRGYDILFANSNDQAFEILNNDQQISIILLDLYWGEEEKGLDILRNIRSAFPDIPILFHSSCHDESTINRIIKNGGVSDYISKDYSQKNVFHLAQNIINLSFSFCLEKFFHSSNQVLDFEYDFDFNNITNEVIISITKVRELDKTLLKNTSRSGSPTKSFKDIKGNKEAIRRLNEWKDMIRYPWTYKHLGIKIPSGILLYGPAGTGKTLLAEAFAYECGVNFLGVSAASFQGKYAGTAQERIRKMFDEAKNKVPCILFLDEIDAIAKPRRNVSEDSGGMVSEDNNVTNELLTYLDGYNKTEGIFVIGATNNLDFIDEAFKRPGRFDIHIEVPLPDHSDRKDIFLYYLSNRRYDPDLNFPLLLNATFGMSGADIERVVNEAAIISLSKHKTITSREDYSGLSFNDLWEAIQTIKFGPSRSKYQKDENLERTAIHEAGHTLMAYLLGQTPRFVTIIPRTNTLGYSYNFSDDYKHNFTKNDLLKNVIIALAGREAEKIFKGNYDTGSSAGIHSDIHRANNILRQMVFELAIFNEFDPYIPLEDNKKAEQLVYDLAKKLQRHCSSFLNNHTSILIKLKDELMKKESLEQSEIEKILIGVELIDEKKIDKIIA